MSIVDAEVVEIDIDSIIEAAEILIKIFFYYFLINRDLAINLSFFCKKLILKALKIFL